jgi:hypothetical protein
VGVRRRGPERALNVFAFSSSRAFDWRWRIVDLKGETVEESSASFLTIAHAIAAGTERLQLSIDRDRPPSPRLPWHRRG